MKQHEFSVCARCRKGVMHDRQVVFYRVRLEYMAINLGAVQRQHGLEVMLGGAAPLAAVLGPNEDLAQPAGPPVHFLLCLECAMREISVAQLHETATDEAPA